MKLLCIDFIINTHLFFQVPLSKKFSLSKMTHLSGVNLVKYSKVRNHKDIPI